MSSSLFDISSPHHRPPLQHHSPPSSSPRPLTSLLRQVRLAGEDVVSPPVREIGPGRVRRVEGGKKERTDGDRVAIIQGDSPVRTLLAHLHLLVQVEEDLRVVLLENLELGSELAALLFESLDPSQLLGAAAVVVLPADAGGFEGRGGRGRSAACSRDALQEVVVPAPQLPVPLPWETEQVVGSPDLLLLDGALLDELRGEAGGEEKGEEIEKGEGRKGRGEGGVR